MLGSCSIKFKIFIEVAAFEALEVLGKVTENCDILGTLETQSIKLLNPTYPEMGISVTYS